MRRYSCSFCGSRRVLNVSTNDNSKLPVVLHAEEDEHARRQSVCGFEGEGSVLRRKRRRCDSRINSLDETNDALVLEALDGDTDGLAGQVRVGGEAPVGVGLGRQSPGLLASESDECKHALPVTTPIRAATERADHNGERDACAHPLVLLGERGGALVEEVHVPGRRRGDLGRVLGGIPTVDPDGTVGEAVSDRLLPLGDDEGVGAGRAAVAVGAKCGEVDLQVPTDESARRSCMRGPTRGNLAHLLLKGQTGEDGLSLLEALDPLLASEALGSQTCLLPVRLGKRRRFAVAVVLASLEARGAGCGCRRRRGGEGEDDRALCEHRCVS